MINGLTTMHHDDQRAFTTEKIDEELKEGVDGKGLRNGQPPYRSPSTLSVGSTDLVNVA